MDQKDLKNTKNALANFMKKQAKSGVQAQSKSDTNTAQKLKKSRDDKKEDEDLSEAKKESAAKAANASNAAKAHMIMRLIIQNSAKYVLMIAILVGVAFLVVEALPLLLKFLHGLFSSLIFGALKG